MRSKFIEEIDTVHNRLVAIYECPYCREENIFQVAKGASTGEITQSTRNCESCGMVMTSEDFIEFETREGTNV